MFPSATIQTVVDELVICLERGEGIAVLTAPAGLGKTLLCEKVKQELGTGFVTILLRHADYQTSTDLLRTLLIGQGKSAAAETEQELRLQLLSALTELRRDQKALVVICDEAHQLTECVLEELRRLVDHADHGVPWVRLMLAGQLDLEEKLAGPSLSALNQRLRSHSTLSPLSAQDSRAYLDYRLTWAGGRMEEVFDPAALAAIVDAADGNPRCLNHLCDHVLLLAYVSDQRPVSAELVREALADLQHLPLSWNIRAVRASEASTFPTQTAPPRPSESADFGSHLASWESTPTFSTEGPSAALPQGEVWEFGADAEAFDSASEPATAADDPFEHLLQTVESEIERAEAARAAEVPAASDVHEELVIDRYAAIDAGWPLEDLPPPETDTKSSPPISIPVMAASPSTAEAEDRLHADVLELVTVTRNAMNSQRIDPGSSPFGRSLDEFPPSEAIETAQPAAISSERPFRNLFTRLRRKQKGLE